MTTYRKLMTRYVQLQRLDSTGPEDDYWRMESEFKTNLKWFLYGSKDDLRALTKKQLYVVLDWCSRYRPIEPRRVLALFGGLAHAEVEV